LPAPGLRIVVERLADGYADEEHEQDAERESDPADHGR